MSSREELTALGHGPMPVLKAIRAKCLDCSGGSRAEVADCLVHNCALYSFRFGSNPWRAEVSPERREVARALAARRNRRTIRGSDTADAERDRAP
jgi:hypothetical protein